MGKLFVGIDNGPAGTVGFITEKLWYGLYRMPHFFVQDYQKAVTEVCRVDHVALDALLRMMIEQAQPDHPGSIKVLIERPFTMKYAFKAMMSGRRALEAVLIVLEQHQIGYSFIDSKEWQHALLPKMKAEPMRAKGQKRTTPKSKSAELKNLSHKMGVRLFPTIDQTLFTDFDGLLIAEYLRLCETGMGGVK